MEPSDLSPRQALLLKLIVQEHIRTAAPVASRTLVEQYQLEASPATVRNDMARLEELGYLWQPHTSAGRLPTVAGYRYFVERLMQEQELPVTEQRMIAHQFYQAQHDMDQWMPLAASVLARRTGGAALVTAPRAVQASYKHLELIATHGRAVLLVLVLQGGTVNQQMLALPEPMTQTALSEAADRLNQLFTGLNAEQIKTHLHELPALEADLAELVLGLMQQVEASPTAEIYHHGVSELLQEPEFIEGEGRPVGLLRILEERSLLQGVLSDVLGPVANVGGMRILIGGEGRWDELRACSMILTRYGVANYATGALGVVGPIRMAYGHAVSTVRFVASLLSELVYDMYGPEALPASKK
jgi:heat-inducible transcriptional repressor